MFNPAQKDTCEKGRFARTVLAVLVMLCLANRSMAAVTKTLPGHVPAAVAHLTAIGSLPATNHLDLAIGLPLRHPAELSAFLGRLYDPTSPDYKHYLKPDEFTERYGPTAGDYEQVKAFARQNNLTVKTEHGNRLVLDVNGAVPDIEQAFHVKFKVYHHPTEARDFYAVDTDPSIDTNLPIVDISGLTDLVLPQPHFKRMTPSSDQNQTNVPTGSGPASNYFGQDYRAAYLPGVTLTGAGQTVGLLEFSGYYNTDVAVYEAKAGLPNVPMLNVPVDSYVGLPTSYGDPEVSLDIEMAVAMAPGLSQVVIFDAGPRGTPNDILEAMVASNSISQFSSSWSWSGGPSTTTDNIFQQMIAQGQSYFQASGDEDAYTTGINSSNSVDSASLVYTPISSPYVTVVGGTTLLTTGPGGAWASESVWNWGLTSGTTGYTGSGGGISSYYSIPTWQQNTDEAVNGGSTFHRNIPDVAANANNNYITFNNGGTGTNYGGTSFAAPIWAGLAAVMNQQAALTGRPAVGFLNPAIYELAHSASYNSYFHDITNGNNISFYSQTAYFAGPGYDLCTGWGTPNGQALINAIAGFEPLAISQTNGYFARGYVGGPFTNNSEVFNLNNIGPDPLTWSFGNTTAWLTPTPAGGTLPPQSGTNVLLGNNTAINSLPAGSYPSAVSITDLTTGSGRSFPVEIEVMEALTVAGASASGEVGGPFGPGSLNFELQNLGSAPITWKLGALPAWLSATPTNGTLSPNKFGQVQLAVTTNANSLAGGVYTASVPLYDVAGQTNVLAPFVLQVGQSIVQNGGFETGDFTDWTLANDTPNTANLTYNGVVSTSSPGSAAVHSGNYGAFFGDSQVATLSQNLTTVPGRTYLLSFWYDNPTGGSGEQFAVSWITNSAIIPSPIYQTNNPQAFAWTNPSFILPATGTNTVLQFAAENIPNYFGLDDVSVIPIPNPAMTFTHAGKSLSVTLYSTIGVNYELLYATNLARGTWIPLSTNTATSTTLTITNSTAAGHPGYYRVLQLP